MELFLYIRMASDRVVSDIAVKVATVVEGFPSKTVSNKFVKNVVD